MLCASNQRLARRQSPHQRVAYMVIAHAGADDSCGTSDKPLPPSCVSSLTRVDVLAAFPSVLLTITRPIAVSPSLAIKDDIDTDHSRAEHREHEEERECHPVVSA